MYKWNILDNAKKHQTNKYINFKLFPQTSTLSSSRPFPEQVQNDETSSSVRYSVWFIISWKYNRSWEGSGYSLLGENVKSSIELGVLGLTLYLTVTGFPLLFCRLVLHWDALMMVPVYFKPNGVNFLFWKWKYTFFAFTNPKKSQNLFQEILRPYFSEMFCKVMLKYFHCGI